MKKERNLGQIKPLEQNNEFNEEELYSLLTLQQEENTEQTVQEKTIIKFFQQMKNPDIQLIQRCVQILIKNQSNILSSRYYDSSIAYESQIRKKYSSLIEEENKQSDILQGIRNVGLLFETIQIEIDKTYSIENFNISVEKTSAIINIKIQKSNTERDIHNLAQQIELESDIQKRGKMGEKLRELINIYYNKFPHVFTNSQGEIKNPKWRDIISQYISQTDQFGNVSIEIKLLNEIKTADTAIRRSRLENQLERISPVDVGKFEQYRRIYGAKAANLLILKTYCNTINMMLKGTGISIEIPDFIPVPIDIYDQWKNKKLTDNDLEKYYKWITNQKRNANGKAYPTQIIFRSSAVHSEDGEKHTGAGIYTSIVSPADLTFKDFKQIVLSVFESTESQRAQSYRQSIGIQQEEQMGLIIQRYIQKHRDYKSDDHGYINSYLQGVPILNEVVTEQSINYIRLEMLDFYLATDISFTDIPDNLYHFLPDKYKVHPELPIQLSQLTAVLKKIWQSEIQIEFVYNAGKIYVVQVRKLPDAVNISNEITFPDEKPVFIGSANGIGDRTVEVLHWKKDNSTKSGIVFIKTNNMASTQVTLDNLPRDGAVVIVENGGQNGHIQTIAAERGLVCIFYHDANPCNKSYEELKQLTKVRFVSNGIEGRIYLVEEDT